jgi:hypothetical protein
MQSKLFQLCLIECEWRMTYTFITVGELLQMFVLQTEWSTVNEDCMHLLYMEVSGCFIQTMWLL